MPPFSALVVHSGVRADARAVFFSQSVGRSGSLMVKNHMNSQEPTPFELLKPADVAARLGVSRTWLYDAARTGRTR